MKRSNSELAGEVADLGHLSRVELAALWEKAYGHPPPKGFRRELLLRSATWHLQSKRLTGLTPSTKRMLKAAIVAAEHAQFAKASDNASVHLNIIAQTQSMDSVGGTASSPEAATPKVTRRGKGVSPGDRLVRDWNGKSYIVDVIEEGFVFQAKVHKSLTAIAQQITGAHWSGPRFFGL